jgi:hypothetical protein
LDSVSGYPMYKVAEAIGGGVRGTSKNLIFAANGPKPEIVSSDAINNDIEIVENAQYCLVFDLPIPAQGLRWNDMVNWWKGLNSTEPDPERSLYRRLDRSLSSGPEHLFLRTYFSSFKEN